MVLVEEEGELVAEVGVAELGPHAVEGAVLVVPLGTVGEPMWDRAARDTAQEETRRAEAEDVLRRLRTRDPGGDIET